MNCNIGGQNYCLISNPIKDIKTRKEYFALARNVFGLDFSIWYNSGFCGEKFIPYTLFAQDKAVASAGVFVSDIEWDGKLRRFAQLSTVMTEPVYRGKGLNRWLIELAIREWGDKCECVYLYANDSVVDYYPKFGFEKSAEYRYKKEINKTPGIFRRLNLKSKEDIDLLLQKYSSSNPYASITMKNNSQLLMFHCLTFLSNNIYYIEQYDAVVIAEYKDDTILCYDIYTDSSHQMEDILGVLVKGDKQKIVLGFTPKSKSGFSCEEIREKDYHVFVLKDNEKIFKNNKISLPLLSHA